jgi:hypothetical protein
LFLHPLRAPKGFSVEEDELDEEIYFDTDSLTEENKMRLVG